MKEILPTPEELGMGIILFSTPGRGFLTGKIDEHTTFDKAVTSSYLKTIQ